MYDSEVEFKKLIASLKENIRKAEVIFYRSKNICRICKEKKFPAESEDSMVLDYGNEHAHYSCLETEKQLYVRVG